MEIYNQTATPSTHLINFNATTGLFSLSGRSTPENPAAFYEPLQAWLTNYTLQPRPHTILHINLEYFNTASSKCLLDLMKKIKQLTTTGNSVLVKWQYEEGDEDMQEAGQDYSDILEIPFEFIEQV